MTNARAPLSTRPHRFDLFGPIHKAIRYALADLLSRMGTTDFGDDAAFRRVVHELEAVTSLCESHLRVEEKVLLPALGARLSGGIDTIHLAHEAQGRFVAELHASAAALLEATPPARALIGRSLYLHFGTFMADLLVHMAEEEQVIQPLFDRLFTDAEVRALYVAALRSVTPEEHMAAAPYLLAAVTPVERGAMIRGIVESFPRDAVLAMVEGARSRLPADAVPELLLLSGLALEPSPASC
jgi:iron-sulfur cluster repair protein YtfE (RIC family)